MTAARIRRFFTKVVVYAVIIVVTLLAVDGICMAFGLFPPTHNYGDAVLGWRPAEATGRMALGRCTDFSADTMVAYSRNEDGVRTNLAREQILADSVSVKIAVAGDSHTELCTANSQLHAGVLEADLTQQGVSSIALTYGAGKYSPLQEYLAFRTVLRPYRPHVLVLNLYTGNDFYDMLRSDDRPHFVRSGDGYRIAEPVWFSLDDPAARYRSRVLYAFRLLAVRSGLRPMYHRVVELRRMGNQQGAGVGAVLAYMRNLLRAREPTVGYPDAFTSQMLNQQLFFHHFPSGREESLRQLRALMELIRRENPGLVLVMSPLPSYQLTGEQPVDSILLSTVGRLPISYEGGVRQEQELYDRLRSLSIEQGWIFVDNLMALKAYRGPARLFNKFDYHLLPTASAIIGHAQSAALLDTLRRALWRRQ